MLLQTCLTCFFKHANDNYGCQDLYIYIYIKQCLAYCQLIAFAILLAQSVFQFKEWHKRNLVISWRAVQRIECWLYLLLSVPQLWLCVRVLQSFIEQSRKRPEAALLQIHTQQIQSVTLTADMYAATVYWMHKKCTIAPYIRLYLFCNSFITYQVTYVYTKA